MVRTFIAAAALALGGTMAPAEDMTKASVVEIATFELADGVSVEDFAKLDARVASEHVSKQPGFVARSSGASETGWVAIVYWESAADSEASMASFAGAEAAADFMGNLDASTLSMTVYELNK